MPSSPGASLRRLRSMPRRRAQLRRRARARSSAHYVGYVEDDETPEAIMKKFEALERVQQAMTQQPPAGGDGGAAGGAAGGEADVKQLTEEQLQEVFKPTSVFTVKSATAGPEFLYGHGATRLRACASAVLARLVPNPSCLRLQLTLLLRQTATTTTTRIAAKTSGPLPSCRRGARAPSREA